MIDINNQFGRNLTFGQVWCFISERGISMRRYTDEEDQTLILSVGIEVGQPITNGLILIVKNTGGAKIVMVS
ncbi:hypothetical protein GCM10022209_00820 [Chitinophaga oryziterrae]